jgi:hypothetical protein
MAEIYKASVLIEDISPEACYQKSMDAALKTMPDFKMWKKRPVARLFGIQNKNDEFSTINFFLITQQNGIEVEVRFNTKNFSMEELKSMFDSFKAEMLKK